MFRFNVWRTGDAQRQTKYVTNKVLKKQRACQRPFVRAEPGWLTINLCRAGPGPAVFSGKEIGRAETFEKLMRRAWPSRAANI